MVYRMTEKKNNFYRNIGIGIGIGIVAIIAAIALNSIFTTPTATPSPTRPKYVTVNGTANNTDSLSYADPTVTPIIVIFTSMRNNNTYEARFNGENYSISLPNRDSYHVTINWQFNIIYAGDIQAGTFNLDATEASITKNWTRPIFFIQSQKAMSEFSQFVVGLD
ncbi:MAG: hypothetical protein ACFFDI_27150 [Promethearchaeota archaeon]